MMVDKQQLKAMFPWFFRPESKMLEELINKGIRLRTIDGEEGEGMMDKKIMNWGKTKELLPEDEFYDHDMNTPLVEAHYKRPLTEKNVYGDDYYWDIWPVMCEIKQAPLRIVATYGWLSSPPTLVFSTTNFFGSPTHQKIIDIDDNTQQISFYLDERAFRAKQVEELKCKIEGHKWNIKHAKREIARAQTILQHHESRLKKAEGKTDAR